MKVHFVFLVVSAGNSRWQCLFSLLRNTFALALVTDIIHFYVWNFLRYFKWVVMGLIDAKTVIHRPDI
jgi:hypothetical protein